MGDDWKVVMIVYEEDVVPSTCGHTCGQARHGFVLAGLESGQAGTSERDRWVLGGAHGCG